MYVNDREGWQPKGHSKSDVKDAKGHGKAEDIAGAKGHGKADDKGGAKGHGKADNKGKGEQKGKRRRVSGVSLVGEELPSPSAASASSDAMDMGPSSSVRTPITPPGNVERQQRDGYRVVGLTEGMWLLIADGTPTTFVRDDRIDQNALQALNRILWYATHGRFPRSE